MNSIIEGPDWYYWNDLPLEIVKRKENSILNEEEMVEILEKWEDTVKTKHFQSLSGKIENISNLNKIRIIVPEFIMERIKEAANLFVSRIWFPCIATVGMINESLTKHLILTLENDKQMKSKNIISVKNRNKNKQEDRIHTLFDIERINLKQKQTMMKISTIRNKYVHIDSILESNLKNDCESTLNNLISIVNEISYEKWMRENFHP
ncbi:MAG: hypothetical protein HeimC3_40740 [Candidatus Heimdallarchaeota archaeon LC_3]|nr:MAG: hypothetical protein HeimC3_40740 [Candidatus Heimdallarchaeota archaeon LC_3]